MFAAHDWHTFIVFDLATNTFVTTTKTKMQIIAVY